MLGTDCCSLQEQAVTGMMDQQHWWKLLLSDKSGLINTDDKPSVLIQTVNIIAVTGIATLSWTNLISTVTERAFFHMYVIFSPYAIITWLVNHSRPQTPINFLFPRASSERALGTRMYVNIRLFRGTKTDNFLSLSLFIFIELKKHNL